MDGFGCRIVYGLSVVVEMLMIFVVFVVDGFGGRFVYGYRGGRDVVDGFG